MDIATAVPKPRIARMATDTLYFVIDRRIVQRPGRAAAMHRNALSHVDFPAECTFYRVKPHRQRQLQAAETSLF
jgi:hypothetical protein